MMARHASAGCLRAGEMARHRLTVRLDADVWDQFQRVLESNGSSASALIQAWCEVMITEQERHGWKPLPEWTDYPPAAKWLHERAREIDANRRNRRRPDAP